MISPLAYGVAALLGALWGSFGNVCIYRMPPSEEFPKGRSVSVPRSHCFVCKNNVRWYDNVPLLSFLWLKGQCRDCNTKFSPRYLLVEAASMLLFLAVYHYVMTIVFVNESPGKQLLYFGIYAAFVWTLLIITFIDIDHQLILDKLTYPAIPIFFALSLLLPGHTWKQSVLGIVLGYGMVRLISDGFYWVTKREGLGYGDGKLLAMIGALLGWKGVLVGLFFGSMLGTVILLPIILFGSVREKWNQKSSSNSADSDEAPGIGRIMIPFGPFIAGAALIYLFTESYIQLHFFGFPV